MKRGNEKKMNTPELLAEASRKNAIQEAIILLLEAKDKNESIADVIEKLKNKL